MGIWGNMGLMGAEISEFTSEQNKISLTLFKIISEQKKFISELFALFLSVKIRTSKQRANADE